MKEIKPKAYTADQFGKHFGKNGAWSRRLVNCGKLKAIKGWGEMMIPSSEIDRMMESAASNLDSFVKEGKE
jgi:hypothetical protein